MLKIKSKLIALAVLLYAGSLYSFPIFYKCGAGNRLEESFAGPEIFSHVNSLLANSANDEQFREQAMILCQGAQDCVEELERIKSLLGSTQDVTAMLMSKINIKKEQTRAAEVDETRYNAIKSYVEAAYTIRACQEVKQTWSAENWTHEDGNKFAVFYPKYSNYMYASGCHGRSSGNCNPNRISDYEERIKSALLMGMDPYLAIGLVWMEGGTGQGLNYLYLDPIGKFAALGCTSQPTTGAKAGATTLNSYSTYYDINPGVIQNPVLTTKLRDFLRAKETPAKDGESYFCRRVNDSYGSIFADPQDESCCLKLPFAPKTVDIDKIEEALVFEQARKNYQRRFRSETDPAFRVQRFNGYSTLMGGAEAVESFRSGVNHYEDPAYGYQTMDFIVNSILTNPVIHQMVQKAEAEVETTLGRKSNWRSIMCVEHANGGMFQIDNDYYFNKHRDSDRLKSAYERWNRDGVVTGREQRIIDGDIHTLIDRGLMSEADLDKPQEDILKNYFKNHYPGRTTVGSASAQQSAYTWENLSRDDLRNIGRRVLER